MNKTELLAHLLLYGADICLMLTVTLLMLFTYKRCPDRSRLFLGIFYLIFTIAEIANSILTIATPNMGDNFIPLIPRYTAISYLIMIFSMLYPIEILRPNWFKLKHFIVALIPWVVILTLLYTWQGDNIRTLNSSSDVFAYIYEPNVWLRLLLSLLFIPFALFILYMPIHWQNSSMNKKQIQILFALLFVSITFFTINNIWRNFLVVNIFRLVCWTHIVYAAYYELVWRINIPSNVNDNIRDAGSTQDTCILSINNQIEPIFDDKGDLLKRLENVMQCSDVWKNPNFQQQDLCRIIGTNRTYLLSTIKQMNYKTFHEMLNSYRIKYVIDELHKNPTFPIQQLYYEAGYRSVITAKRNFLALSGCTYEEYIKKLA